MKSRLKKALENSGKSAYRVAQEMKVSQTIVSYWLSGKRIPSLGHILQLCSILRCGINDIIKIDT